MSSKCLNCLRPAALREGEATGQPGPAGGGPQVAGVAAQEGEGAMAVMEWPVQAPCKPCTF